MEKANIDDSVMEKDSTLYGISKRFIDIVASLAGIICLSPIFLIVSILIKKESKGPIIFSQDRIGKDNKTFKMYKFRSMVQNAEELKEKLDAHIYNDIVKAIEEYNDLADYHQLKQK